MTLQERNGVPFVRADNLERAGGVAHGFSTRRGGVSQGIFSSLNLSASRGDDPQCVRENYRRFCTVVGIRADRLALTRQVHGCTVRAVTERDVQQDVCVPAEAECDALVTRTPGLALAVFTADCIPILLYDPAVRAVAAVHAGWRGTAGDIVGRTVEKLTDCFGSRPEEVLAAIGPGISRCCFETDGDVPQTLEERLGPLARPYVEAGPEGKFHVDLKAVNAALLRRAGVAPGHIEISSHCTACLPNLYWSHRVTQGRRGNQAAVIMLRP
ncbi:MAG: peptidoglycan editing factor PgeF [Oscillospiraceae bacterium]|nr:peptidoglycan editing factor PgeF [Oscillospiraceae bacterium]